MDTPVPRKQRVRLRLLGCAALVIIAGLVLTQLPVPLPRAMRHYGGAVLWGAMVLLLTEAARPRAAPRWMSPLAAAMLAMGVEFVRLVHAPLLDSFRASYTGGLLLGRVFKGSNIAAYWLGIALIWILLLRRARL